VMRVSVTEIDALRYFMAQEDGDLADLIRRMRREEPPTDAMLAGTAFHTALETIDHGETDTLTADGWTFTIATHAEITLPDIREVKATREYVIDGERVVLVGKVDAVHGCKVYDHKLTGRFDSERFLSGFQWRAYLEIFDADCFIWNVFEAPPRRTDAPRTRTVTAFHDLRTFRYPGLGDDVTRDLTAFVHFARQYLPERCEGIAA